MTNNKNKTEILAPCGSYEILIAAVKAGADACYIGGNKFGARAYATNLQSDSIFQAIDYAHLHDVRLYLTVNTLLKNNEIKELYNYLAPYYEAGIDAVIVQDLGVFEYVKNTFPDLSIHCSTQMNINSRHSAEFMKNLGATRIVTAREMSLNEIKAIKENVDIEIESFVHGAMCYSYSGQCLMSSLAGGRSGNRGRCAQPCRKCYGDRYLLSMKDMCSLEIIPQLIEAGIDSLKIEGRMKNEYYVASAVAAYKELCLDYYLGKFSIEKANKLKYKLASIYNRGGFCQSYYFMHNGPQMISDKRPNNQGVYIGKLTDISNGKISVKLDEDIYKQDVFEIALKNNETMDITSGIDGKKGKTIMLNVPKSKFILPNQKIYRTRCNKFIEDIKRDILEKETNLPIEGVFTAIVGEKMSLLLKYRHHSVKVVSDFIVEESSNKPADEDNIKGKLSMLGNTDYIFSKLDVNISPNAFVPMGIVKQLRRDAIEDLTEVIANSYRRNHVDESNMVKISGDTEEFNNINLPLFVGVQSIEQLKEILNFNITGIYIQRGLYNDIISKELADRLKSSDIKVYIELPYIITADFDLLSYLPDVYDGIYVRNIDGFACVNREINTLKDKHIVLGASLYAYNNIARDFFGGFKGNITFEIPKELNVKEISGLNSYNNQLTIYEHQQVMLSAQCVIKNTTGCNKKCDVKKITDDKNNTFYAKAVCDECCNVIYNGLPTSLLDKMDEMLIQKTKADSLRINFSLEDSRQVRDVMNSYYNNKSVSVNITTGHYYRGVE